MTDHELSPTERDLLDEIRAQAPMAVSSRRREAVRRALDASLDDDTRALRRRLSPAAVAAVAVLAASAAGASVAGLVWVQKQGPSTTSMSSSSSASASSSSVASSTSTNAPHGPSGMEASHANVGPAGASQARLGADDAMAESQAVDAKAMANPDDGADVNVDVDVDAAVEYDGVDVGGGVDRAKKAALAARRSVRESPNPAPLELSQLTVEALVEEVRVGDPPEAAAREVMLRGRRDAAVLTTFSDRLGSAVDVEMDEGTRTRLLRLRCELTLRYQRDLEAIDACRAFARHAPDDRAARALAFGAGGVAEALGRLDLADEEYTRAIVLSPIHGLSSADALKARARVRAARGNVDEAAADLRLFLREHPAAAFDDDVRRLAGQLGVALR